MYLKEKEIENIILLYMTGDITFEIASGVTGYFYGAKWKDQLYVVCMKFKTIIAHIYEDLNSKKLSFFLFFALPKVVLFNAILRK